MCLSNTAQTRPSKSLRVTSLYLVAFSTADAGFCEVVIAFLIASQMLVNLWLVISPLLDLPPDTSDLNPEIKTEAPTD